LLRYKGMVMDVPGAMENHDIERIQVAGAAKVTCPKENVKSIRNAMIFLNFMLNNL
jgi:hypothetical protein